MTTYVYDPAGQLLSVDYSDTTQNIAYAYDRQGRRASTIDAAGLTSYAYLDGANTLVTSMTVTPAPGSSDTLTGTQLSYAYDAQLRRQSVTASRLVNSVMTSYHTTGYTYDAASRLGTVTDGVNFATYNYLANSGNMIDNVVYAVDTNLNDGQQLPTTNMFTTTKTYDQLGRFVSHQSLRTSDNALLSSHGYTYNKQGQRSQAQMTDGSYWDYQYDSLGQLTGAAKFTTSGGGGKILPGYQYNYQYDQIGNRTKASTGGDQFGLNQRDTTYQSNLLNQYTQINNHPYISVQGQSQQDATVTVQLDSTQPIKPGSTHQTTAGTFIAQTTRTPDPGGGGSGNAAFYAELEVDTTATQGGTSGNRAEIDASVTGVRNAQGPGGEDAIDTKAITRQTPALLVVPTYDDDGNLTSDDRWTYVYNGENRLVELIPQPIYRADSQVLMKRLTFIYDSTGRRIEKRVYSYNTTTLQHDTLEAVTRYVYDGWLLIAELSPEPTGDLTPLRTYTHGTDLSGTPEGAGGIAGLLFARTINPSSDDEVHAYCYDGNGNVMNLVHIPTPTAITAGTLPGVAATYEYSPFGQLIRVTGTAAEANPFRFSTKYTDTETGFCYYGYRYYDSVWGRWLNRDPIEEQGGVGIYVFVDNDRLNYVDVDGRIRRKTGQSSGCHGQGCLGKNSQVCGTYVWLYTGKWCNSRSIYNASVAAAGGGVRCWTNCSININKCALAILGNAGASAITLQFTHGFLAKPPRFSGIFGSGSRTALQSRLSQQLLSFIKNHPRSGMLLGPIQKLLKNGRNAMKRFSLLRGGTKLGTGAMSVVAGVAIVQAGISINCGIKCSR